MRGLVDMEVCEILPGEAPMELLLEADPSRKKVEGYLPGSRCFAARIGAVVAGVCVVVPIATDCYELMNIAVAPDQQQKGIGATLLRHVVEAVGRSGARRLEVGTGTFGYQLTFYQRAGFRAFSVERDFFITHYDKPIYEHGIHLKDMLRLAVEYPEHCV